MTEGEWEDGGFDPMSDPDEKKHLLSVLDSFRSYRRLAHFNGTHVRRQAFYSLPSEHWTLLSKPPFSILDSFNKIDDLIDANAELAEAIFIAGFKGFVAPSLDAEWVASIVDEKYAQNEFKVFSIVMDKLNVQATQTDLDKARSCIHQFYREWSYEGDVERKRCFKPVEETLNQEFESLRAKSPELLKSTLQVLVPGAGLGRLVFDLCRVGFSVQGNEISYHEIMASSLVLNHTSKAGQFTVAPFALSCSNHITRDDQFRTYAIPDVHPGTILSDVSHDLGASPFGEMSMATGDFCVLYGKNKSESKDMFDAVATVFFIDTAPNIIRYIEAVKNCLKPGGLWINLGPLLWHHASRLKLSGEEREDRFSNGDGEDAGIADPGSVELTDDEVVALVEHFGFTIEKHETGTFETGYISNPESMLQNTYRPSFWVARKK
ncbi:methyltransferase-like protein [Dendryphion nanum]|uniref:carnosine N-methyltransferase n=1 Tax=Dendryphion nanum TaxID=256645 RepID=A0A9P9E016_9PLEO|nr:methyltransferase-like protein [Dendryphion nanum]